MYLTANCHTSCCAHDKASGDAAAVSSSPDAHSALTVQWVLDCVLLLGEKKITICRSPKSGANFFALGNFEEQVSAAYARAQPAIVAAKAQRETAPVASLLPLFAWMNAPR